MTTTTHHDDATAAAALAAVIAAASPGEVGHALLAALRANHQLLPTDLRPAPPDNGRFKRYVHDALTGVGVPRDPRPERTAATGCRIEGRLAWLFERAGLRTPAACEDSTGTCFVCGMSGASRFDIHDRWLHQEGDRFSAPLALIPNYASAPAGVHDREGRVVAEFHGCRAVAESNARRFIAVANPPTAGAA